MPVQIKFGTSGWRAVMAEDFTFANVRRAVEGVARYVSHQKQGARVVVGRDPRFLGESFVELAAKILMTHGITPLIIAEPAPTPAIAYEVMRAKTDGAINFTASHNPAEYNGIKFSTPDGAPALPEVTKQIEAEVAAFDGGAIAGNIGEALKPETIEVKSQFLARLKEIVDLGAIKKAGLKVAFDPLWGAARGYTDHLLRESGIACTTVHDYRDVLFGGHAPEPDDEKLGDLRQAMKESGARIGIATDGDADRFGIVDQDGTFLSPNYVIALLFEYLVETRGWKNGVGKSVVTTDMVSALAQKLGIELHETPVGFKYIGELIKQDKIAIGGEESAGLSIRYHTPEKDGVLAGLLCCEMVAVRGKSMRELLRRLFDQVGSFYPDRQNFRLTPEVKEKLTGKLKQEPREFAGRKVAKVVRTDGLKLVLDDGAWVCYRLSGTEPVVRAYTESRSEGDRAKLAAAAKDWVFA
jgi:alpha-D-glucose phosphate-specific phosphoglucomutase